MKSKDMVSFTTTWVLLFPLAAIFCCSRIAYSNVSCIPRERRALLQLRSSLIDKSNRLSSWSGEDCCNWEGVGCNKHNGHVVKLDLRNPIPFDGYINTGDLKYLELYENNFLSGEINPSLLALRHLNYLDLSKNNFSAIQIPSLFGSLVNLRYLNLSRAHFTGQIPNALGNLSYLQHLDLSCNKLLPTKSISWVAKLSTLEGLDLSFTDLSGCRDCIQTINLLPSLMSLRLCNCRLDHPPHVNLTSLTLLDLSDNRFNSTMPLRLFNMTSLRHLDLSVNYFHGPIPGIISQLSSLRHLDLSDNNFGGLLPLGLLCNLTSLRILNLEENQFQGSIQSEIGCLSQLIELQLSSNKFNGTISSNLWQLSKLEVLDLSYNGLTGEISEAHFEKLAKLKYLYLSSDSLTFSVKPSWIPPFQLLEIAMDSLKVGPRFPSWLQTQRSLEYLSMSNSSISDDIPDWFAIVQCRITGLDLSFNNITGKVPKFISVESPDSRTIDLSSNKLESSPYLFAWVASYLDLSRNVMAGPILLPDDSEQSFSWISLTLNNNNFNGSIPEPICRARALKYLDLSNNQLSGRLPFCFVNLRNLLQLNLANNSLSGQIPNSLGSIELLQSLHLNNNKFHGELPLSLQYLTYMQVLDLGENNFEGIIPSWIGKHLSRLRFLRLQSNHFYGDISLHLCQLSNLQVLNLAQNKLTGYIPRCFNNFGAMGLNYSQLRSFRYVVRNSSLFITWALEEMFSFTGGREREFSKNLQYLTLMDLSQNNLVGEIPKEMMDLVGLQRLNLFRNHLSGTIPEKIGDMKQLISLDLSVNELSGSIPASLANINFLSYLNLSSNKLSGPIPTGNQLQTLEDPSIYAGNSGLCGKPLPISCSNKESSQGDEPTSGNKDDKESGVSWFFAGLATGFAVSSMGIFCILLLKKSWRFAYFQLVENFSKNIWVWIALKTSELGGNYSRYQKSASW